MARGLVSTADPWALFADIIWLAVRLEMVGASAKLKDACSGVELRQMDPVGQALMCHRRTNGVFGRVSCGLSTPSPETALVEARRLTTGMDFGARQGTCQSVGPTATVSREVAVLTAPRMTPIADPTIPGRADRAAQPAPPASDLSAATTVRSVSPSVTDHIPAPWRAPSRSARR